MSNVRTLNVASLKGNQTRKSGFVENWMLSEAEREGTGTGIIVLTLPLVWSTAVPEE